MTGRWSDKKYNIKQKILTIGGLKYWIYNSSGALVGYAHKKAFKLKDEIIIYADENRTKPVLGIKQENILDLTAVFRVFDPNTNEIIGYFGRKYWKSMLKDTWKIFDQNKREIGVVEENTARALLRRMVTKMVPKEYQVKLGNKPVGRYKQKFKMIGDEWFLDFTEDMGNHLDPRLGVAGAIIMATVERFQGS